MKLVGEKLEKVAIAESDSIKKDLFGRSAFNRYYYAAFLVTREMLGTFNPGWKITAHKAIPNLLITSVRKPVVTRLKKDEKKGLITKRELSSLQTKLNKATNNLSNLLLEAYDIRLIADYEPEQLVTEKNKVISLHTCKLTSAKSWADKANAYCKEIRKVWKDSGIA